MSFLELPGTKAIVHTTEKGDLLLKGYAARYTGVDREGEQFANGSMAAAVADAKARVSGLPLCWAHDKSNALGVVLDLEEHAGIGLYMTARVDFAEPGSALRSKYEQIRRGSAKGLSVGGYFTRSGASIVKADLVEISVAPTPMYSGAGVDEVQVKALLAAGRNDELNRLLTTARAMTLQLQLAQLQNEVARDLLAQRVSETFGL